MKKIILIFITVIILGGVVYLGWFFFLKEDLGVNENTNTSINYPTEREKNWQTFKNPKNNNLDLRLIYVTGIDYNLSEIHSLSFGGNDQKILEVPAQEGLWIYPNDVKGMISPDGKKIAFRTSFSDPKKGLLVMNSDGSQVETLIDLKRKATLDPDTFNEGVASLVWSSDSQSILYLLEKSPGGIILDKKPPSEYELWKIKIGTKEKEKINLDLSEKKEIRLEGWSVENNEIYLIIFEDSTYKFLIIKAQNGEVKESVDSGAEAISYPWNEIKTVISPDYSKIAILDKEGGFRIFNLLSLKLEEIYGLSITFSVSDIDLGPLKWSPDSKKVAIINVSNQQIWLMDLEDKSFKNILSGDFDYGILDFSPDNQHIFYVTKEELPPTVIDIFEDEEAIDLWEWQTRAKKTTFHRAKIDGLEDKVFHKGWGMRSLGWGY